MVSIKKTRGGKKSKLFRKGMEVIEIHIPKSQKISSYSRTAKKIELVVLPARKKKG